MLARSTRDHNPFALLFRQGLVDAQYALCLIIEDVPIAVAIGAVAIVHRPAESRAFFRVPIAADCQVMAGEDPGKLLTTGRLTEDQGAAVLKCPAAVKGTVTGQLLEPSLVGA